MRLWVTAFTKYIVLTSGKNENPLVTKRAGLGSKLMIRRSLTLRQTSAASGQ